MQVLSEAEIKQKFASLAKLGMDYVQCDEPGLFYTHPEADCIVLEYPPKLERLPFFARLLATLGYDDADFAGAWLWFRTWGVWSSQDEATGYRIVEAVNRAAGQPLSFEVSRGQTFRSDELPNAVGMLMQPMVFGWDAYYLPHWSFGYEEFFLYISHDSFVSVVTRTKAFHEKVLRILEELEFQPQRAPEAHRNWLCRGLSKRPDET